MSIHKGEFLVGIENFLHSPKATLTKNEFAGIAWLVGVGEFDDPQQGSLPGASRDVKRLAQELHGPLHGYHQVEVLSQDVTKATMKQEAKAFCDRVLKFRQQHPSLPYLTVFIYIATHGLTWDGLYNLWLKDTRWDGTHLHQALSFDTLREWLSPLQNETVVMVLDTCRQIWDPSPPELSTEWRVRGSTSTFSTHAPTFQITGCNWGILTATAHGGLAWERVLQGFEEEREEPESLLSLALWQTLRKPGERDQPWWTFADLIHEIRESMAKHIPHQNKGPVHYLAAESQLIVALKRPRFQSPPRPNPFRPFESFEAEDHERFFGRETVLDQWLYSPTNAPGSLLGPGRHHLLIATSGAGKTSFLKASLLPALKHNQHPVLYLDVRQPHSLTHYTMKHKAGKEPTCSLRERIQQLFNDSIGHRDVIVVLDQVESLFLGTEPSRVYHKWLHDLEELLNSSHPPPYRLVLSLRDDALAYLYRTLPLPSPSGTTLADWLLSSHEQIHTLPIFSPTQARMVLQNTLLDSPICFSPDVIDQVLIQLVQQSAESQLGQTHRATIYPPHLQIVGHALYQQGLTRRNESNLQNREVWSFEDTVDVPKILEQHLADTIKSKQHDVVLSLQEQQCAWAILTALCLRNLPQLPLHQEALLQRVERRGFPEETVRFVLHRLVEKRLLRSFSTFASNVGIGLQTYWAFSHDHMIKLVQHRLTQDPYATQLQHARRLLDTLVYPMLQGTQASSSPGQLLGYSTAKDIQSHFLEAAGMIREELETSASFLPSETPPKQLLQEPQLRHQASELIDRSIRHHEHRERFVRWGVPLVFVLALLVMGGTLWLRQTQRKARQAQQRARTANQEARHRQHQAQQATSLAKEHLLRLREQKAHVHFRMGRAYTGHYYQALMNDHDTNLKNAYHQLRLAQTVLSESQYPLFYAALWTAFGEATRNREGLPKKMSLQAIKYWNRAHSLYRNVLSQKQGFPSWLGMLTLPWKALPEEWKAFQNPTQEKLRERKRHSPALLRRLLRWLVRYQIAQVHRHLAHAHRDRMERMAYQATFAHFQQALNIYKKLNVQHEFTATQVQLAWGHIYGRDTLGHRRSLRTALHWCQQAERFLSQPVHRKQHPVLWADWQHAMGSVWLSYPDPKRAIKHAVPALEKALTVFTPRRYPKRSLLLQRDLAGLHLGFVETTCGRRADRNDCLFHIQRAVALFAEQLERIKKNKVRLTWAIAAQFYGRALLRWPDSGHVRLHRARTYLKQALQIRNQRQHPMRWAYTHTYWLEWQLEHLRRSSRPNEAQFAALLRKFKQHLMLFTRLDRKRMQLRVCLGALDLAWHDLHNWEEGYRLSQRCLALAPQRTDLTVLALQGQWWTGKPISIKQVQALLQRPIEYSLQRLLLWLARWSIRTQGKPIPIWLHKRWCHLWKPNPMPQTTRWYWRFPFQTHQHFAQHNLPKPAIQQAMLRELTWLQVTTHQGYISRPPPSCIKTTSRPNAHKHHK